MKNFTTAELQKALEQAKQRFKNDVETLVATDWIVSALKENDTNVSSNISTKLNGAIEELTKALGDVSSQFNVYANGNNQGTVESLKASIPNDVSGYTQTLTAEIAKASEMAGDEANQKYQTLLTQYNDNVDSVEKSITAINQDIKDYITLNNRKRNLTAELHSLSFPGSNATAEAMASYQSSLRRLSRELASVNQKIKTYENNIPTKITAVESIINGSINNVIEAMIDLMNDYLWKKTA